MEAYKFKAKVSENGTIIVPEGFDVKNKEVEVIILDEVIQHTPKKSMKEFLDKFSGVLEGIDPDKAKYDYLMDKHK
ncbi:hypothetical protein [Pedobacter zeae]|uniref:Uncharacterized protein n=1 Tax=Pedobacter zeae TaxID=1737356 RepID=A0A7W6KEI6_9SPHI|nr:hypothetical protein [Pedobacter zeae]MBB4110373.1 hypothetical protein [Pedobacter zeae]GGH17554.1 hypothetical protein GCM10007422_41110 [Pedobacter zeae]